MLTLCITYVPTHVSHILCMHVHNMSDVIVVVSRQDWDTNGMRHGSGNVEKKNDENLFNKMKNLTPNLHQMRSYLSTTNSNYGIFIHSNSQDPKFWEDIFTDKGQKIIWTSLIPGRIGNSLENIMSLILGS